MANNSSSINEEALVVILPSGLPPELHQCVPEYFPVVDSGVTVHCLWDVILTAYLTDKIHRRK